MAEANRPSSYFDGGRSYTPGKRSDEEKKKCRIRDRLSEIEEERKLRKCLAESWD